MKLTLLRRSLVFATFFGASLALALLAAALGTPHWAAARASRPPSAAASRGHIHFGLFEGHKELDYGAGTRIKDFSVGEGWHPARRWAWVGCAALVAAAAVAAGAAAVSAVLAAAASRRARRLPLLLPNLLCALLCACALCVWAAEFVLRLAHNVLPADDLANRWTTDQRATFGYSYWLVLGAGLVSLVNAALVAAAAAAGAGGAGGEAGSHLAHTHTHEKLHPAIMLY